MQSEKNKDVVLVLCIGSEYFCDIDINAEEDRKFISSMQNILGKGLNEYLLTRDKQTENLIPRLEKVIYVENKEKFAEHVRNIRDEFERFCKYYEECQHLTFQYLDKLICDNHIPRNVRLMSDSGWECSETDMNGVYYNETENILIFTQTSDAEDDKYCEENGWKMLSQDWGLAGYTYQRILRERERKSNQEV